MTIDNASPFFAWDVATWLALFLVTGFTIVVVDRFLINKEIYIDSREIKKGFLSKLIYFILFLRHYKNEKYIDRPKPVKWSAEFYPVLLLVFVLRGFLYEPFQIPSNSMMPTLLTGDFILVNKHTYGLRLPVTNTLLIPNNKPEKGDVVVFRYPNYMKDERRSGEDWIKRVVATPGDQFTYVNDELFINGNKVQYKNIGKYVGVESGIEMTGFVEKLETNGVEHQILIDPKQSSRSVKGVVPEGHYFVMGDNRNRSSDSRFWGFVPEDYIIGKAFAIWMHYDDSLKFDRLGLFN
jgi:signal peptidase I